MGPALCRMCMLYVIQGLCALPLSLAVIELVQSPQSQAVLIGQDLVLNCKARDPADVTPLTYTWYINGKPVSTSIPGAYNFVNHSLYVPRIQLSELGGYHCSVQHVGKAATLVNSLKATVVKAYIGPFFLHPESQIHQEGAAITLTCITGKSAPPALVHWQKDGLPVTAGNQSVVTFGSIGNGGAIQRTMQLQFIGKPELSGTYCCVARNPLTRKIEKSKGANVTVSYNRGAPIAVVSPPAHIILAIQLPLTLDCVMSGWPEPELQWYKDGSLVQNSSQVQLLQNGSLYIKQLQEADEGVYVCNGSNSMGSSATRPVNVTVAFLGFRFVKGPQDLRAIAGQRVTLTCAPPPSRPPAKITWYKDSKPFTPRSGKFAVTVLATGDLHFSSIQSEDAGWYFCIAINIYSRPTSRTSHTAVVIVQGSPIFTEPPISTRVVKGRLLMLHCRVQGNPFPTIQWYQDNLPLISSPRVSLRSSSQELVIMDANKADEGQYKCRVHNQHGQIESPAVTVSVLVPPEIIQPVRDVVAAVGSYVVMQCGVYGDPAPSAQWFKDGQVVTLTNRIKQTSRGLEILNVTLGDEGTYRCKASNIAGNKESQGTLTIQVDPALSQAPQSTAVNVSQSVSLQCEASGNPLPRITWSYNDNYSLPGGVSVQNGGKSLVIMAAKPAHTGNYTCTATNLMGHVSHNAFLLVQEKPNITRIAGKLVVPQAGDLVLTCEVKAIPVPSVTWYFDGSLLQATTDSRIVVSTYNSIRVKYVHKGDDGQYRCVAKNNAGVDSQEVKVIVRETPLPPELLVGRGMSRTSVYLQWKAVPQVPSNNIDFYVIEYKTRSSKVYKLYRNDIKATRTWFEVGGLQPATEYFCRIAARNDIGTGAYSQVCRAVTLETAPSAPRNLHKMMYNATVVKLQWELPAHPNGEIKTYELHYKVKYSRQDWSIATIAIPSLPLQKYTLSTLKPYTTYLFKVRGATISAGLEMWGTFSNALEITTNMAAPSSGPSHVTVLAVSSTTIQVTWQHIPAELQNGPVRAYIVMYRHSNSSSPFMQHSLGPNQLSFNISGLLPWRYYDIRMQAYNDVGKSPRSEIHTIRTWPTAPSASPSNVTVIAMSSRQMKITWQDVADDKKNADLSGFYVRYKPVHLNQTTVIAVDNPAARQLNVSGLEPYTTYEVQVLAYTFAASEGQGPYSSVYTITTKQDVPGAIRNVTVIAGPYEIKLSWLPPVKPNGIITRYTIVYMIVNGVTAVAMTTADMPMITQPIQNSTFGNTIDGSDTLPKGTGRKKRTMAFRGRWTRTAYTTDPNVTLTDLAAQTIYVITMVAETSAGKGRFPVAITTNTLQGTPAPHLPTTLATSQPSTQTSQVYTLTSTEGRGGGLQRKDIPVVVAACLTAAGLLTLLIILIILWCCRKNKSKKGVYFIPPSFKNREMKRAIGLELHDTQRDRMSSQSNGHTSSQVNGAASMDVLHSHQALICGTDSSQSTPEKLVPATGSSCQLQDDGDRPGMSPRRYRHLDPIYDLTYSSLDELNLQYIPENQLRHMEHPYVTQSVVGLDNPVYEQDDSVFEESMVVDNEEALDMDALPHNTSQDLYSQANVNKRRKNRMKSSTAAAIAAQRNRVTSVFSEDTDALIGDDAVVVYDQRTAL